MSSNSLSSTPTIVPLPARQDRSTSVNKPPIWPIDAAASGTNTPLASKCAQATREDGICCKELIKDERTLIDPDVVRDVVIGLSDGLTVPFALAAGLASLGESRLVVLGGVAELIAGAISMGIGGFLASQSERDHYRYLRSQTAIRVKRSCSGEMEREVSEVLGPIGVDEKTCRSVARCLREVEIEESANGEYPASSSSSSDLETSLRWSKDVGLTAFLLKFGQGLEEIPDRRMYISAFTIGMGYLVGGLIPLLPYFFIPKSQVALIYSCILTGIILLIFGAVKARVTGAGVSAGSYVWGAVSTLMVGGIAAGAAFAIVAALEG
ncbi:membrane fraction protein [Coprinopsis cinerea okayama7|uniref:Membrane fraction protein n=1 Tax=Coprinopsis cinerea (strain Okayama-7 / 130 / ATCC MYA-4618 / FGSC 9003) TaxID=240176 RepID=A8NZC8_COPC7|nr:membrane fraction protein [Coprinopsis cinerea okayama7\|eukprot:XP_001837650.1 membrane fraction protein [Coprinopsis cinerea okayama7\